MLYFQLHNQLCFSIYYSNTQWKVCILMHILKYSKYKCRQHKMLTSKERFLYNLNVRSNNWNICSWDCCLFLIIKYILNWQSHKHRRQKKIHYHTDFLYKIKALIHVQSIPFLIFTTIQYHALCTFKKKWVNQRQH